MEEFAEVEVARSDAGFEEEGGVDEVVSPPWRVVAGEAEGGDGFAKLRDGEGGVVAGDVGFG